MERSSRVYIDLLPTCRLLTKATGVLKYCFASDDEWFKCEYNNGSYN